MYHSAISPTALFKKFSHLPPRFFSSRFVQHHFRRFATLTNTVFRCITLILEIMRIPEHGNSSEKSRLATCRQANINTCWYLLFGLLCFHVDRSRFEGQSHLRRWRRKLKKRSKQRLHLRLSTRTGNSTFSKLFCDKSLLYV